MLLPNECLKFENLKEFKNFSMGSQIQLFVYEYFRNEFIPFVDKANTLHLDGIKGLKEVFHDGLEIDLLTWKTS